MKKKLLLWMFSGAAMFFARQTSAQEIFALSNENLISFNSTNPGIINLNTPISGVQEELTIEGLDFRPATGELFAVGYNQTTGATQLFVIDKISGQATPIGATPLMLEPGLGDITFDFNPTVDRIRFMGSSGTNYRLNPISGGLAASDGSLAYAASDVNAAQTANVITSAYTNSFIGTTSTTLYNYDSNLQILTLQNPPNAGALNTIGVVGGMLDNMDPSNGDLEIYFNTTNGSNSAFFVGKMIDAEMETLYDLNLATGALSIIGNLPQGIEVDAIATEIQMINPMVEGQLVYALTSNNYLISFDSANPNHVISHVSVSGITSGQTVSGLDVRPMTGELYALGYNNMSGEARLYVIDPQNGVASAIGDGPVSLSTGMERISFDFNPTVDRIRVLGLNNVNYRLHPVTGAIAFNDSDLAYASGDINEGIDPNIGACAYTNSFGGATATTLYNYDEALNIITSQVPPNNGVLNTIGASGIMLNPDSPTSDMDIFYSSENDLNLAFLNANVLSSNFDNFYSIDLTTGAVQLIGTIGYGIAVNDIAVAIEIVDNEAPIVTCPEDQMLNVEMNCMASLPDYTALAMAMDNMDSSLDWSQFPEAGSMISGETEVMIMAMDDAGNVGSCSFTLSVVDMEGPMLTCIENINQSNPLEATEVFIMVSNPLAFDNCGVDMITNSHTGTEDASGFYPIGTTTVTFSAIDVNGNTSTCSIDVTVEASSEVSGDLIYAMSRPGKLIAFSSDSPEMLILNQPITGLMDGFEWVGLDSRPATGELYALAFDVTNQMAQLYVINPTNGAAVTVGSPSMLNLGNEDIAFDFNPTVDRIRVVGANNMNYRLHPVTGAIAATDISLAYAAGDVSEGMDPMVGSVAYTYSFNGTSSTTLYDLDFSNSSIVSQIPPNDGVLNTIGSIGFMIDMTDMSADMDIFYDLSTQTNRAYLAANAVNSNDNLYMIDLSSGIAMDLGMIGNGEEVLDIAAAILEIAIGVDERTVQLESFALYPNPANDFVQIKINANQPTITSIVISDMTGKTAYVLNGVQLVSGSNIKTIDISELSSGIYTVNFRTTDNLLSSQKLVIK